MPSGVYDGLRQGKHIAVESVAGKEKLLDFAQAAEGYRSMSSTIVTGKLALERASPACTKLISPSS
ncbi:MAG: hypothetical protein QOE70_5344 [Chthoniobacter sp.]|nr:hypothetical protein [Chthoniobacter sp.]